jgi:uncharacterized oligopeptide transporter (OPT) family protein
MAPNIKDTLNGLGDIKEVNRDQLPDKHPSALDPAILILNIIVAVLGAIIGLELITRLGISTNTSIIGALIAILIARIPFTFFKNLRQINSQNLIQTAISGATFSAANALLLPIGIPYLMGRTELVIPMLIGASLALLTDATILYWIYDTEVFPAEGIWPPGIATAEAILAAAQKGKKALILVVGGVGGVIGKILGIPTDVFGVSWIGNVWALGMFGVGLILRGYSSQIFNTDINQYYVPHGIMIGAGLVALIQIITKVVSQEKDKDTEEMILTKTKKDLGRGLGKGFGLYLVIALLLALIGGLITHMSVVQFIFWFIFAAIAAIVSELIVGISAMHSGWFPAFATALIFLVVGMLFGFPPVALALLVGFTAATGPAFADMAYDFKAGWILRGSGESEEFELEGRKQQYIAEVISFLVAIAVVFLFYNNYFSQNLFPPVDRVYVATIEAGTNMQVAKYLLMWAIPGALIQWFGGSNRQLGILFATGLLINYPIAGMTVLVGIAIRLAVVKKWGLEGQKTLYILGAGFIAGAALYSFFSSTLKLGKK